MTISGVNGDSHATPNSHTQKLFVMRHGQRWDDAHREWVHEEGVRRWDPPLTDDGMEQARSAGEKMRSEGVLISRIVVSPFLRCVQTAAGFIKGMYPEGSDISNLKVFIEFGLSELMNNRAIWYPPPDPCNLVLWNLPLDDLIFHLPSEVVDISEQPVFPKLPNWEETREDGRNRFVNTFQTVADKFPTENILCISHGEGVKVSFMHLKPEVLVNYIHYCAYTQAEREVFSETLESPLSTGPWKLITELGPTSGLMFREKSPKSLLPPETIPVNSQIGHNKNQHIEGIWSHKVVQTGAKMEAGPEVETIA